VTAAAIAHLGFGGDPEEPARHDGPVRLIDGPDGFVVLDAVRVLPDDQLDQLLFLLPVLCLGQDHVEAVDTGESLLNRIATDLGVAMRAWWKPDATFLTLLTREQLLHIAGESGAAAYLTGMNGWTKRRLVDELTAQRKEPPRPRAALFFVRWSPETAGTDGSSAPAQTIRGAPRGGAPAVSAGIFGAHRTAPDPARGSAHLLVTECPPREKLV